MTSVYFHPDEWYARQLDADDRLVQFRDRFYMPRGVDGRPVVYLCGHSLGLQPKSARACVQEELDAWARLGVEAHFRSRTPWYSYHAILREAGARLAGALPDEVVFMNSLTVNLHLMLATFYRPTPERYKVLIDEPSFPSDRYAVASQVRHHGLAPFSTRKGVEGDLLTVGPRPNHHLLYMGDLEKLLESEGRRIAVVLLNPVNYVTGQVLDVKRLVAMAHRRGCLLGLDLAHAIGNVPLQLHDWGVDFAVWCSYKYLNGGPGAVGGCFVHERHGKNLALPRLAGWWGNDPLTRFHNPAQFLPAPGADGWQVSNPPILSMAPVRASLTLFDEAGMEALRHKSIQLTGYLLFLLERYPSNRYEVITPAAPEQRGCQVSLLVHDRPRALLEELERSGVVCDFREPNIIRVAPVPLYNSFTDVWTFVNKLRLASHV
jgi:kynureninase